MKLTCEMGQATHSSCAEIRKQVHFVRCGAVSWAEVSLMERVRVLVPQPENENGGGRGVVGEEWGWVG